MQLSSDLWQEERKLLLIWNDRTKSCSWCPCRSFMCTYLDLSKGAEETECQVRGKVLSPAQFWGLPWGFSRGVHKHWLSTGRPEATEISLKVYQADEGWLEEWIWEIDLQRWVGRFGERAQGRVKESKCLQDNAPSPQFCLVCTGGCAGSTRDFRALLSGFSEFQLWGWHWVCTQCQLLFKLGSGIGGIKWSWSRNVTAGLTAIDYINT